MSLLFMDSFKNYTFLPLKWDEYTTRCRFYITEDIGRKGGQALRVYSNDTNLTYDHLGKELGYNCDEVILGFAFKKVKEDIGFVEIDFNDGDSIQSKIKLFNTSLVWYKGDESIDYGANSVLKFNDWNYFEAKIRTHTTSGTIDICVNEQYILSESNIDTTTTANNYIDRIRFKLRHYADTNEDYAYIEDLYIANTSGTTNNDFLGNCEIAVIYPHSAGTHSEFALAPTYSGVDNYTLIDETIHQEDTATTYSDTFLEYDTLDDGCYTAANFYNTATTTDGFALSYEDQAIWFRFSNVNIPKHAKIISANIQLYVEDRYTSVSYSRTAYGCFQKSGTEVSQVTGISDLTSRTKTDSNVSFVFYTTEPTTLNYASSLQELVDMDDWQEESNKILFQFYLLYASSGGSATDRYRVRTYTYRDDPYHSDSPKLFVEWSLPGGDNDEYVTTSGIDTRDTYNVNTASGISNIFAINHNIFSKRDFDLANNNDLHLIPLAVVSGTTYSGTTLVPPDRKYKCLNYIEEKNPYTNDTWLLTDMATNEFGFTTISG